MPSSRMLDFIGQTQRDIFRRAQHDLQLTLKAISADSGIPASTLATYANGSTPLPLTALKGLLRIEGMGALLSALFEPEAHALVAASDDDDHAAYARHCARYGIAYTDARDPGSECGIDLGPREKGKLTALRRAA